MSPSTVPVGAIAVGERDREDMGDIKALAASIRAVGLLHPVVVTEAMTLIAGGRRLEAVRELGWTELPVTVVNLATVGDVLRAEADENVERKPLAPTEALAAAERRARVLTEDAKRRQREHGGTAPGRPQNTSAKFAEVSSARDATPERDARAAATQRETRRISAIGTGLSHTTLGKVANVRDAAERGVVTVGKGPERRQVPVPEPVKVVAQRALEDLKKTSAAVDRAHKDVQAAMEKHLPPDPDDPHRKWRRNFLAAIAQGFKPLQFTPEAIVERADDECLDELRRLAKEYENLHARVVRLVADSTPDNLRKLRVV